MHPGAVWETGGNREDLCWGMTGESGLSAASPEEPQDRQLGVSVLPPGRCRLSAFLGKNQKVERQVQGEGTPCATEIVTSGFGRDHPTLCKEKRVCRNLGRLKHRQIAIFNWKVRVSYHFLEVL